MRRRKSRNQRSAQNRNMVVLTSWTCSARHRTRIEQTRRLATAILLQAFKDLAARHHTLGVMWHEDAMKWFLSDATAPGSLEWACDLLCIDARDLRSCLRAFQRSSATGWKAGCIEIRLRINF